MSLPHTRPVPGTMPLVLAPPFRSTRLSMSYLPLRANIAQLTRFCDEYLNVMSPEEAEYADGIEVFLPRWPVVYLIVADHPRLESRTDGTYVVQHELAFSVPVEVRRRERGRWRIAGFAFTQPFIYVDSPLGMTTGRQVWGWPKAVANFEGTQDWASGRAPLRMTMPEHEGEPLLVIGATRGLPGLASGAWRTMATSYAAMMREGTAMWLDPRRALDYVDVARRQLSNLPRAKLDIVTLKQFPAAYDDNAISYQAIVRSTALITRLHDMRGLGAERQLLGDLSGGLRVDITGHPTQPVVELLGLEPDRTTTDARGRAVASFEPLMPFRAVIDAEYDGGQVLWWRDATGPWYFGHTDPDQEPSLVSFNRIGAALNRYCRARGAAIQIASHPRTFKDLRLGVYPLATHPKAERLLALCRDCLGARDADAFQLELLEHYVYLVTAEAGSGWPGFVYLCVPVRYRLAGAPWEWGVVMPFEYSGSGFDSISATELAGARIMPALLRWGPHAKDSVALEVWAELAPELGRGGRAERLPILKIDGQAPHHDLDLDPPPWRDRRERRLAADVLSFVQFPDARFLGRSCVQSYVKGLHTVVPQWDHREDLPEARVIFYDYPSHALVDLLDLADAAAVEPGARAVRARGPWRVVADLIVDRGEPWKVTPDVTLGG